MKNLTFVKLEWRGRGTPISKIRKSPIQNGSAILHERFSPQLNQKVYNNRTTDSTLEQVNSPPSEGVGWGRETRFQNFEKRPIHKGGPNPHRKFQQSSSIRKSLKIEGTEMRGERKTKGRHSRSISGDFQSPIKTLMIRHFDTRIFAIRFCVPT